MSSIAAAPPRAGRVPSRVLKGAIKLCASLAMVAIAWRAAGARLHTGLLAARPDLLVLAFLALNVGQALAAIRLRLTMDTLGRRRELGPILRAHFVGLWFNQALPTGIGGDVAKVMTLRTAGDLLRYARAVLLTRIFGLAALLATAAALTPFYAVLVTSPRALYAVSAASCAALVGLAALMLFSRMRRLRRALPPPGRFLLLLGRDMRRFGSGQPLAGQAITSALIVLSICCTFELIGRSLGHGLGLWTTLIVVPPVIVSMHLPMSYAGWGTREVGAVVLLPLAGVGRDVALTISILYGILLLGSGLIGLVLWQLSPEAFAGKAPSSRIPQHGRIVR